MPNIMVGGRLLLFINVSHEVNNLGESDQFTHCLCFFPGIKLLDLGPWLVVVARDVCLIPCYVASASIVSFTPAVRSGIQWRCMCCSVGTLMLIVGSVNFCLSPISITLISVVSCVVWLGRRWLLPFRLVGIQMWSVGDVTFCTSTMFCIRHIGPCVCLWQSVRNPMWRVGALTCCPYPMICNGRVGCCHIYKILLTTVEGGS